MGGNMKSSGPRRSLVTRAGAIVAIVAVTGVVPLASPAGASTSTYSGIGYDASYPQGLSTPPLNMNFAIIGVTHGRPFTTNQYASKQWNAAPTGSRSLYFNTGYALAYAKSDTTTCKDLAPAQFQSSSATGHALSALEAAWAIGCSEAAWAIKIAPGSAAMWWADVETGNSWSTNVALNQAAISGMAYEIGANGASFGIYSSPSMWASITGSNFVVPGVAGDWQAGVTTSTCPSTGFTLNGNGLYAPVLVAQTGTLTGGGGTTYDADLGCQ